MMKRSDLKGLPTQPRHYDVIVIGSGIGGLTAAGLLARVAGKRVLVLEKHLEPGGLTHAFRRDGASWDVGVHYIGQLEEGSPMRRLFDYLSDGRLRWNRMPEDFEHLILPGVDFRIPSTPQAHQQRLIDAFPDEAKAIRRYFRDIRRAVRWASLGFMQGMVPRPVVPLLKALQWLGRGFGTQTTGHYLQQHFRSPALRALLACRWGDYGLPPAQSAFAIHATIVEHFQGGAWFPAGGSSRIARCIESGIEAAGGAVRVGQQVTRILLDAQGRACGVQVRDLRRPDGELLDYQAEQIISTIGAAHTFETLLPTEGTIGRRTARLRTQIEAMGTGLSAVVLYLRLKDDARSLGVQGENLWISTDLDQDDVAANSQAVIAGRPRWAYVSFPSIKASLTAPASDLQHAHTAEIISFVDPAVFAPWQHTRRGERGADYAALKERISAGLLALAETALPGLRAQVSYAELSTPLSVVHYTSHRQGAFYGMPATPARFREGLFNPRTPIDGLHLGGQDACALGIFGAMMGGLGAACQVLGARGYPMIQTAIRRATAKSCQADQKPPSPPFATNFWPDPFFSRHLPLPPDKYPVTLLTKRALTPGIWRAEFLIDGHVPDFVPGQFARLCVADACWRDYSIAGLRQADAAEPADSADSANSANSANSADAGDYAPGSPPRASILHLLISTRTGGEGSRFITRAPIGTQTLVELPLGQYTLQPGTRPTLFIATGTGLAPFLPMFEQLARQGRLQQSTLLFGCRSPTDDISTMLDGPLPGTVIRCYSRATPGDEAKGTASAAHPRATTATSVSPTAQAAQAALPTQAVTDSRVMSRIIAGRVTTALAHLDFEPAQTDIYLCGSAAMVADCQALLLQRGATQVHAEPF